MSPAARAALEYARANRQRFVAELAELVRIPSVSGEPARAGDVMRCADVLARALRGVGCDRVEIVPGARHPAVIARTHETGGPALLVYGHFDVQPAHMRDGWRTPPFEPRIVGESLRGRGAADDKGQLLAHVKAIESWTRTAGRLPVDVVVLLDGEEEIGSPGLEQVLRGHVRELRADAAVISDTRMLGPRRPTLTYGLRGSLGLELEVSGPRADLHSGNFGGAVHNPAQALCELIAQLHDRERRISVPGLYDAVVPLRGSGPPDAEILRAAGVRRGWGERGWSAYERTTVRPALIVNGLTSGYQGPGGKSIVPARASAKLQVRLAPGQERGDVERAVRARIAALCPPTVTCTVRTSGGTRAVVIDPQHPILSAAAAAAERAFGAPPALVRSGGTIPAVSLLQDVCGLTSALLGFALPSSRIHAPNERFHLPTFFRAIDACILLLEEARTQLGGRRRNRVPAPSA